MSSKIALFKAALMQSETLHTFEKILRASRKARKQGRKVAHSIMALLDQSPEVSRCVVEGSITRATNLRGARLGDVDIVCFIHRFEDNLVASLKDYDDIRKMASQKVKNLLERTWVSDAESFEHVAINAFVPGLYMKLKVKVGCSVKYVFRLSSLVIKRTPRKNLININ
jgi:tRNA nucleotidyltransferase (CCA-adding enzyme)